MHNEIIPNLFVVVAIERSAMDSGFGSGRCAMTLCVARCVMRQMMNE